MKSLNCCIGTLVLKKIATEGLEIIAGSVVPRLLDSKRLNYKLNADIRKTMCQILLEFNIVP